MKIKGLKVDLTDSNFNIIEYDTKTLDEWLGGKGLGVYLLLKHNQQLINPLSPENCIIFTTGPFTGTNIPGSQKSIVITKSPLTNLLLDSVASSSFSELLLSLGYHFMIITGASGKPVKIELSQEEQIISTANSLWGKSTGIVKKKLELNYQHYETLCIGPAGENLVRYANIASTDGFFGRCGAGAVFGSKKLKAIQIKCKENFSLSIINTENYKKCLQKAYENIFKSSYYQTLPSYGTPISLDIVGSMGWLPTRNFKESRFERISEICPENIKQYYTSEYNCKHCPIPCIKHSTFKYKGQIMETRGPQYQTVWAFGPNCCNSNIQSILLAGRLCDEMGLDTISTGNCIAFLMECSEEGIIDEKIKFGDSDRIVELIKKISQKSGIGALISDGVKNASKVVGKSSNKFAMQIKGLELPGYDPRWLKGYCLGISIASRGGCHRKAPMSVEKYGLVDPNITKGKGKLLIQTENMAALIDSLILCGFVSIGTDTIRELLSIIKNKDITNEHLNYLESRIVVATRLFNLREGMRTEDDRPPDRIFETSFQTKSSGRLSLSREEFAAMITEYYSARGYDKNGIPTGGLLKALSLDKYF